MAGIISKLNINGVERDFYDPDASSIAALVNGTYTGVDLTSKLSGEISGNVWSWIAGRIEAENFKGLNVGDFIPFNADDHSFNAQIAGINTYKGFGSTPIGNHIDFITKELWHEPHAMNSSNTNNGTAQQPCQWLAMSLHSWLEETVFPLLPASLRSVIVSKHMHAPQRYDAGGAQSTDTGFGWIQAGKLWVPTEFEILGAHVFATSPQACMGSNVQYPLFQFGYHNMIKDGAWWTMTADTSSSSGWVRVYGNGTMNTMAATSTSIGVPLCFRISA